MENAIIIISMLLLCIGAKDKRLQFVIAASCGLLELAYMAEMDIALYYGICAMISSIIAVIAIAKVKTDAARVLCVFMIMQAIICLCLVPDWSYYVNNWLQFKLNQFNDILIFVLIGLGASSNEKFIDCVKHVKRRSDC